MSRIYRIIRAHIYHEIHWFIVQKISKNHPCPRKTHGKHAKRSCGFTAVKPIFPSSTHHLLFKILVSVLPDETGPWDPVK